MNIVLIGYRCSGKTSVGKRLAAMLGLSFYDADVLIQEQNGQTIREIVASGGWTLFRSLEKKVIAELSLRNQCVIALGGGAILDPDNIKALKINGRFIWLVANIQTIVTRMTGDEATAIQRPPLLGRDSLQEINLLLEQREPFYRAAADMIIDTQGMTIDDVAERILASPAHNSQIISEGGL
jgi:shikimate kinase